jgi:hypothetical protein
VRYVRIGLFAMPVRELAGDVDVHPAVRRSATPVFPLIKFMLAKTVQEVSKGPEFDIGQAAIRQRVSVHMDIV